MEDILLIPEEKVKIIYFQFHKKLLKVTERACKFMVAIIELREDYQEALPLYQFNWVLGIVCDDCKIKIQSNIQCGYSDHENVFCPKCNKHLGEIRDLKI